MRRRFDDAVAELGELEIENSLTNQEVLEVIQRGELLTRLAKQVRKEVIIIAGKVWEEIDVAIPATHLWIKRQKRLLRGLKASLREWINK